jgi:hypothetical protein
MPNPTVGVVAGTAVTGILGSREAGRASGRAADASLAATQTQTAEARRQFDLVREDTALQRELGNEALMALSFLTGVRQPPTAEAIGGMESELSALRSQLSDLQGQSSSERRTIPRNPLAGDYKTSKSDVPRATVTRSVMADVDYETFRRNNPYAPISQEIYENYVQNAPTAGRNTSQINSIQERISQLETQLDEARSNMNMADELGGGDGEVPDLNSLFEGVDMPDIESFLSGLGEDLENSRGYQFELNQGKKALESTLAARGTAYGGNAIKAMLEYSQDYASTKYGERYQQAFQEYDAKRGEAVDQYRMNLDKYNLAHQEQRERVGDLFGLAGYGAQGINTAANAGGQYVSQVGSAARQHARTVGEGAYAQAGANTQALSNIGNTGMTMWMYNDMMNQMRPQAGA